MIDIDKLARDVMNIQCRRDDASFRDTESRLLYKEGHRDARHDAADLIEQARASQPEGVTLASQEDITGTTGAIDAQVGRDAVRAQAIEDACHAEIADLRAQLAAKGQGESLTVEVAYDITDAAGPGTRIIQANSVMRHADGHYTVFIDAPASAQPDRGGAQIDPVQIVREAVRQLAESPQRKDSSYVEGMVVGANMCLVRLERAMSGTSPASQPVAPEAATAELIALLRNPQGVVSRGVMLDAMRRAADLLEKHAAVAPSDAKDAARYRWFKDNYLKYGNSDPDIRRPIILFDGRWYGGHFDNIDDLDPAIDGAMAAAPSSEKGGA